MRGCAKSLNDSGLIAPEISHLSHVCRLQNKTVTGIRAAPDWAMKTLGDTYMDRLEVAGLSAVSLCEVVC